MKKFYEMIVWMVFSACSAAIAILMLTNTMYIESTGKGIVYTTVAAMFCIALISFNEFRKQWDSEFNKDKEEDE